MDSLRTSHARVAALVRHRLPNDPELIEARRELARCLEQTRELRALVSTVSPTVLASLLHKETTSV